MTADADRRSPTGMLRLAGVQKCAERFLFSVRETWNLRFSYWFFSAL